MCDVALSYTIPGIIQYSKKRHKEHGAETKQDVFRIDGKF